MKKSKNSFLTRKKMRGFIFVACVMLVLFFASSEQLCIPVYAAEQQAMFPYMTQPEEGKVTDNQGAHEYYSSKRYARAVKSYLFEHGDGSFTRVENDAQKLYVENWSSDFNLKESKELDMELPVFGGFYQGENYNFIVFGQHNNDESDSVEVMRVVKYDKSWKRLNACSVNGANTYKFAAAGSLDMAEGNGNLVIHTCHEMYKYTDGRNHQANMTFVINEDAMTLSNSYYDIMNISYGYVSHSFNQFVEVSGDTVYRMDHGDANPRSLVLTKAPLNRITDVGRNCLDLYKIGGNNGNNNTGLSAGGLLLTDDGLLAVGNSVDQESSAWNYNGKRNIFLVRTDGNLTSPAFYWLTNYDASSTITVGNPYVVKKDAVTSYIIWEETDSVTKCTLVRIAEVNNNTGETKKLHGGIYGRLSDCKPIVAKDGTLVWYSSDGSSLSFYKIDTSNLEEYAFKNPFSMNDCTVVMEKEEYIFTGSAIRPVIKLTYDDYILKENIDYTMDLQSNRYPGDAIVSLKGKGAFEGELTKTFVIKPIDISGYQLVLNPAEIEYDGFRHDDRDIEVSVLDGDTIIDVMGSKMFYPGINVGKYQCTLTGNERYGYTGALTAYLTITPKSIESMELRLSSDSCTFDGFEKKPSVELMQGEMKIATYNYDISYSNNINVGTATVTLTGQGNYTGTLFKNFQIKPVEISEAEMEGEFLSTVSLMYRGIRLVKGKDYRVTNEESEGKIAAVFEGIGNFTGTVEKSFEKEKEDTGEGDTEKNQPDDSQDKDTASQKVEVRSISISGNSKKIAAGKKIKLTAKIFPAYATEQQITWSSSNTKIAKVTASGVVTLQKKTGGKSVVITASAPNGVKATYKVKSMGGIVKKVVVTGAKTVKAGKSIRLKAKVTATKGANKKLQWKSSNTKYATVSASGKVKTKKAGKGKTVKITAMSTDGSNKKKTVTIKMK